MQTQSNGKSHRRGIYLLPNLLTSAGIFSGFYSIVASMQGHFDMAAITIFIAMVMDSLDGRVARLTNTQSEFGVQYDSLADIVSFGLAPALVVYNWSLMNLGKPGWLASFLYAACGALRLARFNTQAASSDKRFFQGLPIPAAAGVIAGIVWLGHQYVLPPKALSIAIGLVTVTLGLLMVSNVRYNSFKKLDFKGKVPFFVVIIILLLFIAISMNPPAILFVGFCGYALSGPIITLRYKHSKRKMRKQRYKNVSVDKDKNDE